MMRYSVQPRDICNICKKVMDFCLLQKIWVKILVKI